MVISVNTTANEIKIVIANLSPCNEIFAKHFISTRQKQTAAAANVKVLETSR